MLKLLFWLLLAANGALLAYQQGYLANIFPDGREPKRLTTQLNPELIKVLPASVLIAPPAPPSEATPAEPAAALSVDVELCTEVASFEPADATRFEQRLASLALGAKMQRRTVQEAARSMVFIPSLGSKEAADKKAGELRRFGVTDFFVIQEGAQRWGISLGIFRTDEAERAHLQSLTQKGVQSAKVGQFSPAVTRIALQFRGLDKAADAFVTKVKIDFPRQEVRRCE